MSTEKKRLVFDVTPDEYHQFKLDTGNRRTTAIEYFRDMWCHYEGRGEKGSSAEMEPQEDQVARSRKFYVTMARAIINILSSTENSSLEMATLIDNQEKWETWSARLQEIAAILQRLPAPGSSEDTIGELPTAPTWIKPSPGARVPK